MATGFPPFMRDHELNIQLYYHFTNLTHGVRRAGSAALDLCSVAAGRFDGFWELKLNPWDKAAGQPDRDRGRGQVTDLKGGPFELLGEAYSLRTAWCTTKCLLCSAESERHWRSAGPGSV